MQEATTDAPQDTGAGIRALRRRLYDESRSAFLWADLAFLYATTGLLDKAVRAMEAALGVAKSNRYVLRSAARFFVHIADLARAHDLLRKNERTPHDPWLLAAEIAVAGAARRHSRLVKTGRQMLLAEKLSSFHASELSSAIGTLEYEAGRRGREFTEKSLVEPTENAIAQAAWHKRHFGGGLDIHGSVLRVSSEAHAWQSFKSENWGRSLKASKAWLEDQPFSSRPAVFGSYVAAVVLANYDETVEICRRALEASPDDRILRNNLAFAYANRGQLEDAARLIEDYRLPPDSDDLPVFTATRGLIHYRRGDTVAGRHCYLQAMAGLREQAPRLGLQRSVMGLLYFASEALRAGDPGAEQLRAEAVAAGIALDDASLKPLTERLLRQGRTPTEAQQNTAPFPGS